MSPLSRAAMAAFLSALAVVAAPSDRPAIERAITVRVPGKVVLTLDRAVYEDARADLGDLRILDDQGQSVPYLLERVTEDAGPAPRPPLVINRAFVKGQSAEATLDFGGPILKSEILLELSGDNFRRRVVVDGRNRHEPWVTLVDGAFVFAIPGPSPARYETVRVPENNYRFLRVMVMNGPDDPERVEILGVRVRPQERRRPREVPLAVQMSVAQDTTLRETVVTLDLGARHQPFRGLALEVAEPQFFRGAVVEVRQEPHGPPPAGRPAPPLVWNYLADANVYRYPEAGAVRESLRLDVVGRARVLRVRLRNRDDQPLTIEGVVALAPVERLVFEAAEGRSYRVTYGRPEVGPPSFDIARTVGDPGVWIAQATEGTLAAPVKVAAPPPKVPWTERHPAVLWGGLVGIVVLLGAVTWRALKTAG